MYSLLNKVKKNNGNDKRIDDSMDGKIQAKNIYGNSNIYGKRNIDNISNVCYTMQQKSDLISNHPQTGLILSDVNFALAATHAVQRSVAPSGGGGGKGFADRGKLAGHFSKHKSDTGTSSEAEYLQKANDLITRPGIQTKTKKAMDGTTDTVYYDAGTNEFSVVSSTDHIRTYFKPGGAQSYYDSQ